ncbi:hypothetical protein [Tenacibaculum sp. 190524A05c]|uniref:Uncharacterized protein n=1 Tax=Tenacibaculum platacis TaxID=3137852 RepID=A0ABM9NSD8_9FLAO
MKFQKRFGNRRRTKPQKGLFLVILLAIALFLFFNAERLLSRIL